jgi:FPC/CPF motif-containing protein YcgG
MGDGGPEPLPQRDQERTGGLMFLVTYQFKEPNDNLSGPGYSWRRASKTFRCRESLIQWLKSPGDGWYGPDDYRNHRIYKATRYSREKELLACAAGEES